MYGSIKNIIINKWNKHPPIAWYKLLTDNGKLFEIFFCNIVELVIAINAIKDDITPIKGKSLPISNPKTSKAPMKPKKIPTHCLIETISFKILLAKALVNIGCKVTIKAVTPVGIPMETE